MKRRGDRPAQYGSASAGRRWSANGIRKEAL